MVKFINFTLKRINKQQQVSDDLSNKDKINKSASNQNRVKNKPLSQSIIDYLNKKYNHNSRPNQEEIKIIALNTRLNCKQVNVWFLNKRLNQKKQQQQNSDNNNNNNSKLNNIVLVYNDESKQILLNEFEHNKYPDRNTCERLASETNTTHKQVRNWFTNKRRNARIIRIKTKKNLNKRLISSKINKILLKEYENNRYPSEETINELVLKSNLSQIQIKRWFNRTRYKLNKTNRNYQLANFKTKQFLLNEYEKNKYPDSKTIERLALETNLSTKKVYNWFRTQRSELKLKIFFKNNNNSDMKQVLLKEYNKNKFPNEQTVKKLAAKLNLTSAQVKRWFNNTRNSK